MRRLLIAAILVLTAAGCGGGEATPEDSIRSTAIEFADHIRDDKLASACKLTEDQQECLSQMALAKTMLGDDLAALIPDDYNEQVEAAKVTIDGNTAVLHVTDGESFVKRDGKWLIVIEMEKAE